MRVIWVTPVIPLESEIWRHGKGIHHPAHRINRIVSVFGARKQHGTLQNPAPVRWNRDCPGKTRGKPGENPGKRLISQNANLCKAVLPDITA